LVERNLAKVEVASSNLVSRSRFSKVHQHLLAKREVHISHFDLHTPDFGAIAKRLCNGLQIRLAQFDSGSRLQYFFIEINNLAHFWWAFLCLHFPQDPPRPPNPCHPGFKGAIAPSEGLLRKLEGLPHDNRSGLTKGFHHPDKTTGPLK
jgi:hypothetical protein